MAHDPDRPASVDQTAQLEQALIADFLERRGLTTKALDDLPANERRIIMKEASSYASAKLAEVESRAHYINDLHHTD